MGSSGGGNPGMAPQGAGRFSSGVPIAGQGGGDSNMVGNRLWDQSTGFLDGAGGGGGDSGAMRQQLATLQSSGGNGQFGAARDSGGGSGAAEGYAQQHSARYGSRPELTNPVYAELLRQSGDFRGNIRPTLPRPGG